MARKKVDNKLNVVIGTKAQIEGDTSIPENSIIVVTDEELKADEIAYSVEKNVKEAIDGKQDKLVAGDNIIIDENTNVISASGGLETVDWEDVENKPNIPEKTSDLTNDSDFTTTTWVNANTRSNTWTPTWDQVTDKPSVIIEDDPRLTDARPASDVSDWAKASTKPSYSKSEVGLGNVDNTTDLNKPISTATQTALNLKANDNEVVKLSGTQTIAGNKTFDGDTVITGNLTVSGDNFIAETTTVRTDDDLIELRSKGTTPITTPAGIVIKKYDGENDGGIVIKNDGEVRVGKIVMDEDGAITNGADQAQPVLTRAEKTALTNNALLVWDSTNNRAVTKTLDTLGIVPTSRTINDKALTSNITLTAEDVGAAPTTHSHEINDVNGLQTVLDGKALTTHSHSEATTSAAGFLSKEDKAKLDGIAEGAQENVGTDLGIAKTGTTNTITSSTGTSAEIAGATTTQAGLVTTGAQTWNGAKTFNSSPIVPTPTNYNHAANMSYVGSYVGSYVNDVVEDLAPLLIFRHATQAAAVGSGGLLSDLDAGGFTLTGVRTPTAGGDATNKTYVDTTLANAIADIEAEVSGVYRPSGNWNAVTNTPAITSPMTEADVGKVFYVETAEEEGTERFGFTWHQGDKVAIIEGGVITKWDNVDDVTSVNGQTGPVVLTAADISGVFQAGQIPVLPIERITGLETALSGKALTSHTHEINDVNGLQGELDGLETALSGKALTSHTHEINDVTGLETVLEGKALTSHTHEINDVNGLQVELNEKVVKVAGKGLSENDFTNTYKTQLDNAVPNTRKINDYNLTEDIELDLDDISDGSVRKLADYAKDNQVVKLTGDQTIKGNKTFDGNTVITGDLTVSGANFIAETTTVRTDDDLIELRSSGTTAITTPAGIVIKKYDGTNDGGIVIKNDGEVRVGKIVMDEDGAITDSAEAQPVLTRDERSDLTTDRILMWSDDNKATNLGEGSEGQFLNHLHQWATPVGEVYDLMTNTVLGLGKVFSNTTQTVAANSVSSTAARTYGIQKNASGQLVVNVPWSDTNTTYTAGTNVQIGGSNVISATDTKYTAGTNMSLSGTTFSAVDTTYTAGANVQISGSNVISATDTKYEHPNITRSDTSDTVSPGYSGTFTAVDSITSNAQGHISAINLKTVTMPTAQSIPTVNNSTITITAGSGLKTGGNFTLNQAGNKTITLDHSNSITADTSGVGDTTKTLTFGGTLKVPTKVTYDDEGHITGIQEATFTMPANPNIDTKNTVGATNNTNKIHLVGVLDSNKNTPNPQSFVSTGEVSVTNGSLLASGKITGAQLEINDILGTGGVSDAGVLFKRSGNSNEYKFNMSSNNFNIISNDLRSIVVYPNSNVYIGDTTAETSTYKLTVDGTSNFTDNSIFDKNVSIKEAIKLGSTEQSQIIYNEGTKSIDFVFV